MIADYEVLKILRDNGVEVSVDDTFILDFIADSDSPKERSKILKNLDKSENGCYMLLKAEGKKGPIPCVLVKIVDEEDENESGLMLLYADDIAMLIPVFTVLERNMGTEVPTEVLIAQWYTLLNN